MSLRSITTNQQVGALVPGGGTATSSLTHLKRLPINHLKIDRIFVADMHVDQSDAANVGAVIKLGHSLDKHVAAEGVENETQTEILRALERYQMQGYLIARPMHPNRVPEFLNSLDVDQLRVECSAA